MELKENLKQTEVGILPLDWNIKSCDEVFLIIDGDRGSNYPSKN